MKEQLLVSNCIPTAHTKPDTCWACTCIWQVSDTRFQLSAVDPAPLGRGPSGLWLPMNEGPSPALSSCHTQLPLVVSLFALGHPQTLCTREEDRLTRSWGISLPPKEGPGCRMRSRMTIPESLRKGAVRTSGWNLAGVKSHGTISTMTWRVHVFDVSVSVLRYTLLFRPFCYKKIIQGYFIIWNCIHQSRHKMMPNQRDSVTVIEPLYLYNVNNSWFSKTLNFNTL